MKFKKKTLDNGVRVVTVPMKDNPAVTVMVLTEVGSNNEDAKHKGIAHFLEHMCMKGGEKYATPYAVSSTLDALGAESNAMTGHEFTGYYAKGHPKHFRKMLDVVADVYQNARIDEAELEKERGVIIEEINMYHDFPLHRVQGLFYDVLYGDQPAGWHTLGTKETVTSLSREDFVRFKEKHYHAENTLVVVAGEIDEKEVMKQLKETFASMPQKKNSKRKKPAVSQSEPKLEVEKRDTDQAHLVLGTHAYKASDKRVPALEVLNAVLGGGMSSRLFQKLREEMGVCYYVRSRANLHDTHGFLAVSAGVDTSRLTEVTKEILSELRHLRDEEVDPKELKKAKDYLIGKMFLGLEDSEGAADFAIEQEILTRELKTPNQLAKEVRAVTAKDIQKVARDIFKEDKLNMAVVGNVKNKAGVKKALTL